MPAEQQCCIALHFDSGCDRRHYQAPDAAVREIAVILPGDGDHVRGSQDIILYRLHSEPLQCIADTHPFYPALHYVLLYPTGQLSYHPDILYQDVEEVHHMVATGTPMSPWLNSITIASSFATLM
jgi:hypothetical protein